MIVGSREGASDGFTIATQLVEIIVDCGGLAPPLKQRQVTGPSRPYRSLSSAWLCCPEPHAWVPPRTWPGASLRQAHFFRHPRGRFATPRPTAARQLRSPAEGSTV